MEEGEGHKSLLDSITLVEGELAEIWDKVMDTTAELV